MRAGRSTHMLRIMSRFALADVSIVSRCAGTETWRRVLPAGLRAVSECVPRRTSHGADALQSGTAARKTGRLAAVVRVGRARLAQFAVFPCPVHSEGASRWQPIENQVSFCEQRSQRHTALARQAHDTYEQWLSTSSGTWHERQSGARMPKLTHTEKRLCPISASTRTSKYANSHLVRIVSALNARAAARSGSGVATIKAQAIGPRWASLHARQLQRKRNRKPRATAAAMRPTDRVRKPR